MQKPFNSILIPPSQQQKLDSNHPMQYVRTRNNLLNNMIDQIQIKSNLNPMDLQRNVHVQYLTRAYDRMKQKVVLAQKQKKRYLNPNSFQTILDTKISKEKEADELMKIRMESERNRLYQKYIENYVEEQRQIQKPELQILSGYIERAISPEDQRAILLRQRQMELLDHEIDSLRLEIQNNERKQNKKDANPIHNCTNMSLIQKISGSIISSYMVHFDELFALLIDDILNEQVDYLNSLENDWKSQNKASMQNNNQYKNLKPDQRKVIELIKQLDDLYDI